MTKVKLGVIGYGNMGSTHVRNIMTGKVPNMEVGAICDISAARREAANANYPEIPVFETAEELFKSGTCDAVIIATIDTDLIAILKVSLSSIIFFL